MAISQQTHANYIRRRQRTRARLADNQSLPRLSVHRTLRHMYAQIIDDVAGRTLATASDFDSNLTGTKTERASQIGKKIAELAKEQKVTAVRFDRGGRRYHGRIAAVAKAAREHGLQF